MHAVDKYLYAALKLIKAPESRLWNADRSAIKKAYKGYISSFGTIVKQSGLLPAAVLFGKSSSERSEEDKSEITRLLLELVKEIQSNLMDNEYEDFIAFAADHQRNGRARREVLNAAVALKLAIRTCKIES